MAPIGSGISDEQASLLAQTGKKVIVLFDGDGSGRAAATDTVAKLHQHKGCFVTPVSLPDGTDPADLTPDDLQEALDFVV